MAANKLRIIPLGGLGEVGKNMLAIEYGRNILIVDSGGMFPEVDMYGIDLVLPDYTHYLAEKQSWVRGIVITHGHEDHIGSLPYLLQTVDAPVYATQLTAGLIDVKLRRHNLSDTVALQVIKPGKPFNIGGLFEIEAFHVCHSIPDAVGFAIRTPVGLIVHSGDFKFDYTPAWGPPPDFGKLAQLGDEGVLLLLSDSTNAGNPGFTPSEKTVTDGLDQAFREAPGRVIIATFASLVSRVQQIIDVAARNGRVVAVDGRSLKESTERAQELGYLKIPRDTLVELNTLRKYRDDQIVIIATGTQGESSAALGRMATGQHRQISIKEGDTVILSSRVIPGRESEVNRAVNRLFQRGANVITGRGSSVHVSGHASQEELKLLLNLVKPQYFIPVHGELQHLHAHSRLAQNQGISAENICVMENGMVAEFDDDKVTITERIPGGYIFVDGHGVGDTGRVVLRDRELLSQNGFVLAVVRLNQEDSQPTTRPEIITRGFIYIRESGELLTQAEDAVMSALPAKRPYDAVRKALSDFVYKETGRQPMILPVIIEE
ncbi:MAG: ribonuclease J [Chloroflexota bacterium]